MQLLFVFLIQQRLKDLHPPPIVTANDLGVVKITLMIWVDLHMLSHGYLQFKLYRSNLHKARCVHSFCRFLLTKERFRQLLVAAADFEREQGLFLYKERGHLVFGPVKTFLLARRSQDERDLQIDHQKKLRALDLSTNEYSLKGVHNFSNRVLSASETELLNKGLDVCFFPPSSYQYQR